MTNTVRRVRKCLLLVVAFLFLLAPARAEAATQHVAMENYAYSPATLTIRVGDTVTWTNHDQAPHDVVTTSAPAAFRSPLLNTGESWSFTCTPTTARYTRTCEPRSSSSRRKPRPPPRRRNNPPPQHRKPRPRRTRRRRTPAAAAPAPTPTPTTTTQAQQPTQTAQAAVPASLDPMLLVAGLVAGVTILCLLLMNARPEP